MRVSVNQDILRFYVSMANTYCMNVSNRSYKLISVEFDQQRRNHLFHFHILFHDSVQCIRNEIHDHIQVNFIRFLSISIEKLTHLDAVCMMKSFKNFKFTVLIAFILEHLFNSDSLASFCDCSLEHDTKRSVANDFLSIVCQTLLILLDLCSLLTCGLVLFCYTCFCCCCYLNSSSGTCWVA